MVETANRKFGFFGNYWFETLLQVIIILFLLCWLFGDSACGAY